MGLDLIDKKIEQLEDFEQNSEYYIILTASKFEDLILDLNRDQMEDKGQDSTGKLIRPKYTPYTVKLKKAKGHTYKHVTLTDTGDFSDAMFVEFGDNFFYLGSEDPKTGALMLKYGDLIFGLDNVSLKEFVDSIRDEFIDSARKKITA